jgi:CheY-like chemotaxis protein
MERNEAPGIRRGAVGASLSSMTIKDAAKSLALLLKITGNETQMAVDGEQAVQFAQAFAPEVILLDIGLPKLNGYDACRQIRAGRGENQPVVIALTGWGQQEDRERTKDAGFDAHLVKPIQYTALITLLESLSCAGAPQA